MRAVHWRIGNILEKKGDKAGARAAYETLLLDAMLGDASLFTRADEVEAAWCWVEPILEAWAARPDLPKPYAAGSWGPTATCRSPR